jgi:hypothetical protein
MAAGHVLILEWMYSEVLYWSSDILVQGAENV